MQGAPAAVLPCRRTPCPPCAPTALRPPHPAAAESAPKGGPKGPGRQFIEDTYLQRKRRRERYK